MPGFFEALENIKKPKEKVHTVTIQGKSVVVTLEKKLEVMAKGEDAYIWKTETEFVSSFNSLKYPQVCWF